MSSHVEAATQARAYRKKVLQAQRALSPNARRARAAEVRKPAGPKKKMSPAKMKSIPPLDKMPCPCKCNPDKIMYSEKTGAAFVKVRRKRGKDKGKEVVLYCRYTPNRACKSACSADGEPIRKRKTKKASKGPLRIPEGIGLNNLITSSATGTSAQSSATKKKFDEAMVKLQSIAIPMMEPVGPLKSTLIKRRSSEIKRSQNKRTAAAKKFDDFLKERKKFAKLAKQLKIPSGWRATKDAKRKRA